MTEMPEIRVEDLRSVGATQLSRQTLLISWSLVMFRLSFIEDITSYAAQQGDRLGKVESLTEQAAIALDTFNFRNLSKWLKSVAAPQLDSFLSRSRYAELANEFHAARSRTEAQ